MENSGYDGDTEKSMELAEVKTISARVSNSKCEREKDNHSEQEKPIPNCCDTSKCREMHAKYLQDKTKVVASPWHRLKTLFLVGIIIILAVWVLLYILFAWMKLL